MKRSKKNNFFSRVQSESESVRQYATAVTKLCYKNKETGADEDEEAMLKK